MLTPRLQYIVDAVKALGRPVTASEVQNYLRQSSDFEQRWAPHQVHTDLLLLAVNADSRCNHKSQNGNPRRTDAIDDPKHINDQLFRRGPKGNYAYELYQPETHGIWEIYRSPQDNKLHTRQVDGLSPLHIRFENEVRLSKALSSVERKRRLSEASVIPQQTTVTTNVYKRNPDVVAEVLSRAKGICEECRNDAPFNRRTDNSPYLEVHHRIPLADGGEDSVANATALCPNCHRRFHFGSAPSEQPPTP